jgi:rare lipoprotein A
MLNKLRIIACLLLCLSGCKSLTSKHCENSYDQNYKGSVKVGSSYEVKNKTYEPKLDQHYDEVGMASWYGHSFHCKKTANGEAFNKHQLSAAHKTLPLPSVVKVTNLSNNKTVIVTVNDRGPFTKNRIIDISEKAAVALGMKHHGVAKVRVQFLAKETNELMNKIPSKKKIYYKNKPKHKFEISVAQYQNQKTALTVMQKVSKFGKVHLLNHKNNYDVILIAENKLQAQNLSKKLINLGYKNAKVTSH